MLLAFESSLETLALLELEDAPVLYDIKRINATAVNHLHGRFINFKS